MSSTDWEELGVDWDIDRRVLRTTINGSHAQELAIAGDAGGFSNMTVCLEGGEGEVQRLAIAQVMAESHRPGISGFDFSKLTK